MAKSDYRCAVGYHTILTSLVKFAPQPRSLGVRYARRTYLGDGAVLDEGAYIELLWSALDNDAQYRAVLTQLGLHNSHYQVVTLYARDDLWNYNRYGGIAHRPLLGTDASWEYMPKDITILVRDLELLP
jgi:hypothetical protein